MGISTSKPSTFARALWRENPVITYQKLPANPSDQSNNPRPYCRFGVLGKRETIRNTTRNSGGQIQEPAKLRWNAPWGFGLGPPRSCSHSKDSTTRNTCSSGRKYSCQSYSSSKASWLLRHSPNMTNGSLAPGMSSTAEIAWATKSTTTLRHAVGIPSAMRRLRTQSACDSPV